MLKGFEKFICVDNRPKIFSDGSSDDAGKYLTVGKIYEGKMDKLQGRQLYIEVSDRGGPPHGHRWWDAKRFVDINTARETKLIELGI